MQLSIFILFFLFSLIANTASLFFLILFQFYLITVLLLFHSILSCASCILLSLRMMTFFKKKTFVTDIMSSQLLVSLNYSLCINQIYISVCSFIALRKFNLFHTYILSFCVIIKSQSLFMFIL